MICQGQKKVQENEMRMRMNIWMQVFAGDHAVEIQGTRSTQPVPTLVPSFMRVP